MGIQTKIVRPSITEVGVQTEIVHCKEVLTQTEIIIPSHQEKEIQVEMILQSQDSNPELFPQNKESTPPITSEIQHITMSRKSNPLMPYNKPLVETKETCSMIAIESKMKAPAVVKQVVETKTTNKIISLALMQEL